MVKQKAALVSSAMPIILLMFARNTQEHKIDLNLPNKEYEVSEVKKEDPRMPTVDTLYEECINHLKKYESFSDSIYIDNDGSKTIGYGHHIKKNEKFADKITEKKADFILRKDFNRKLKWVRGQYELEDSKLYALALFCFNIGETKLHNSTLNKLVKKGKPIDNEIVKWKWFKYKGEWKENKRLKERRKFELKIFNFKKI